MAFADAVDPVGPRPVGDLARAARTVEWLKAELLAGVASVARGQVRGREDEVAEGLGDVLLNTYLLARRMGVGFARLDLRVLHKLQVNIDEGHALEAWYSDLSALRDHLDSRARRQSLESTAAPAPEGGA